jgi:glucose-1-phosphate thymidylyltransferase
MAVSPERLPLVGVAPMAGHATRLGAIAGSKEVLPVAGTDSAAAARPVCDWLFDAFAGAGVERAFVVLRPGKWDVPATLGAERAGVPLAYVVTPPTPSVPATLDRAFPFVREARVALGFPDVLALPTAALGVIAERQERTAADVVLALFPTDRPAKADMVAVDGAGRVEAIEVKPAATSLRHTWLYAVWSPAFTTFLHERLETLTADALAAGRELQISDVLLAAIAAGLRVEAETFADGSHLDVGTPDDLARARHHDAAAPAPASASGGAVDEPLAQAGHQGTDEARAAGQAVDGVDAISRPARLPTADLGEPR